MITTHVLNNWSSWTASPGSSGPRVLGSQRHIGVEAPGGHLAEAQQRTLALRESMAHGRQAKVLGSGRCEQWPPPY